jgi:hypothetical protein
MRKVARILSLCLLTALVGGGVRIAYSFARYTKVEREISGIKPGQPRTFVISKIGMPNYRAGACGSIGPALSNCALEYIYSHPFAPFIPEYHVISFSVDDRVIDSEELDSP